MFTGLENSANLGDLENGVCPWCTCSFLVVISHLSSSLSQDFSIHSCSFDGVFLLRKLQTFWKYSIIKVSPAIFLHMHSKLYSMIKALCHLVQWKMMINVPLSGLISRYSLNNVPCSCSFTGSSKWTHMGLFTSSSPPIFRVRSGTRLASPEEEKYKQTNKQKKMKQFSIKNKQQCFVFAPPGLNISCYLASLGSLPNTDSLNSYCGLKANLQRGDRDNSDVWSRQGWFNTQSWLLASGGQVSDIGVLLQWCSG